MDKRWMNTAQKWEAGKGSRRRPTNEQKFRENYDRINWKEDTEVRCDERVQRDTDQCSTE